MKRYLFLIIFFLSGCFQGSNSQEEPPKPNEQPKSVIAEIKQGQVFILQMPDVIRATKKHGAKNLETVPVRWIKEGNANFIELIRNTKEKDVSDWGDGWFNDQYIQPDQLRNRNIKLSCRIPVEIKDDQILIHGWYYSDQDGFVFELKLVGKLEGHLKWKGTGKFGFGIAGIIPPERKEALNISWQLFPEGEKMPDDPKLLIITSDVISSVPEQTVEEMDAERLARIKFDAIVFKSENIPLVSEINFRTAKQYPESQRLQFILNAGDRERERERFLYARDKIISDIDWNEIIDEGRASLPKLFFAIDHLASLKENNEIMDRLIRRSFDEEGVTALENDFRSWVRIPLLFLFVYYNDWLTPERVERLNKLSNRIRLIIEEVKKYGNDSPNKLDEIMISVLSKLSDQERRDYFVKSIKLRNYVTESNNLSLQKLMPKDLPPPPGPPENMRDWIGSGGSINHGAFVRLEDDPKRGKVLIILDADRIELRLGFNHMSKETQRYITEMLEAQAEDAAEAEKNKTTPKN